MPRPEWVRMSVFDRRYCCPWCPFEAPVPSLVDDHKTKCLDRPKERDRGSE